MNEVKHGAVRALQIQTTPTIRLTYVPLVDIIRFLTETFVATFLRTQLSTSLLIRLSLLFFLLEGEGIRSKSSVYLKLSSGRRLLDKYCLSYTLIKFVYSKVFESGSRGSVSTYP